MDPKNRPSIDQICESKLFNDFIQENYLESIMPLKTCIKADHQNSNNDNSNNLHIEIKSPPSIISEKSINSPALAEKMKNVLKITDNPFPRRKHRIEKNINDKLRLTNANNLKMKTKILNKSAILPSNPPEKPVLSYDKNILSKDSNNKCQPVYNNKVKYAKNLENPIKIEISKINQNDNYNGIFMKSDSKKDEKYFSTNNCLEPLAHLGKRITENC